MYVQYSVLLLPALAPKVEEGNKSENVVFFEKQERLKKV
jgi:hypothetical protein